MRGIEPPCAAWEAAILPLNYTRRRISDLRFQICDCKADGTSGIGCIPLKSPRSTRAAWVGILVCAFAFQFAHVACAQTSAWDSGASKDWFKDDQTPIDPKNLKKPQKPIHRLAKTDCDDCQKIVDQLQNALDNWYALELADANDTIKKSVAGENTDVSQADARAQKEDAMAGLGQKERPAPKGKNKADVKKEIKKLSDALTECLKKCAPTPTPTATPTPTPEEVTPAPQAQKPPALPNPITLPAPPPCFDTEADREAFIDKWEKVISEQLDLARRSRVNANGTQGNKQDPWYIYYSKSAEIYQKSADDLRTIVDDAANKTKTPVPCPKKTTTGGGGTSKPTPTPKGKPKRGGRTATGGNISLPQETFCTLIADNKIDIDITGTGETIGHVADARITNFSDEPVAFVIPPTVLESRSKKNQNYGVPHPTDVALGPYESKKIPLDGVCLDRHKRPVGKGVGNDLAFNDCDPDRVISRNDGDRMLRISESVYQAADELEEDGQLKEIPYKDPEKRKDIVKQWATWVRMSEVTGDPPPTKDDLKKVVEKQVGKAPPDQQKKLDEGIDKIFEKIELTTEKAKDLEKENENEPGEEATPGGNTVEISDRAGKKETPTPGPGTQEKKKKKKKDKPKKYPPDIQKWLDAVHEYWKVDNEKERKELEYKNELKKWGIEHNKHYKELSDVLEKAKQKITDTYKNGGHPTKEDFDDMKKALKELDEFGKEVGKDFQKTEVGKGLFKDFADAEDIANKAKARADEAGKNIDEGVKDEILKKED